MMAFDVFLGFPMVVTTFPLLATPATIDPSSVGNHPLCYPLGLYPLVYLGLSPLSRLLVTSAS